MHSVVCIHFAVVFLSDGLDFFALTMADRATLQKRTVPELKALLSAQQLECSGKKAELIERLLQHSNGSSNHSTNSPSCGSSGPLVTNSTPSVSVGGSSSNNPPEWAKTLQQQVAAVGQLVSSTSSHDARQDELRKPSHQEQYGALVKIKAVFSKIEVAGGAVEAVTKAAKEGKQLCDERMQLLRIADSEGWDVALAYAREPLVADEAQRKRLVGARASTRRSAKNNSSRSSWSSAALRQNAYSPRPLGRETVASCHKSQMDGTNSVLAVLLLGTLWH